MNPGHISKMPTVSHEIWEGMLSNARLNQLLQFVHSVIHPLDTLELYSKLACIWSILLPTLSSHAWLASKVYTSCGILRKNDTDKAITFLEFSGGSFRSSFMGLCQLVQKRVTHDGCCKISSRKIINWDTMARIFMCIPYARRKSHNRRTSERGGVHAENVKTATN